MKNPNYNLGELFFRFFEVKIAQTDEEKYQSYQLRFQTYCHDFGYISPEIYPQQIEQDEFDQQAIHCLVTHKATGTLVGSVRCLRPNKGCKELPHLPFEDICKDSILPEFTESMNMPRQTMIEISRITVNQAFRRKTNDSISALETQLAEQVSGILALCAYAVCEHYQTPNAFAIMESFLARRLQQMGIPCYRRGKDMKFYGIRTLYYLDVNQIGARLPQRMQQFLHPIQQQLFKPKASL